MKTGKVHRRTEELLGYRVDKVSVFGPSEVMEITKVNAKS